MVSPLSFFLWYHYNAQKIILKGKIGHNFMHFLPENIVTILSLAFCRQMCYTLFMFEKEVHT